MSAEEAREPYTPTTEEIRGFYVVLGFEGNRPFEGQHQSIQDWRAEFDRWLAAHDAEKLAEWQASREVTEAEVTVAHEAFWSAPYPHGGRDAMRAALVAAREVRS